jgi:hypothetical protein
MTKAGKMIEELKRLRQEAIERGEFVLLTSGERLVPMPLVIPGRRGRRVYLGEYGRIYYRSGRWRYTSFGYLEDMDRKGLVYSPLRKKEERGLPREVENLFRFVRTASPDLNPLVWENASRYLKELKAAMGVEGDPNRIYQVLSERGWRESYPLPDLLWQGASLKQPWSSLRSLTGGLWDVKEGLRVLRRLVEEAAEKGVAWLVPPSRKYNVKIGLRVVNGLPGYETVVSAEYWGLAHGHYGLIVNWRGTVFLSESD